MKSVVFVRHSVEGCAYGPEVGILAFSFTSISSITIPSFCCSTSGTYLRVTLVLYIGNVSSTATLQKSQFQEFRL